MTPTDRPTREDALKAFSRTKVFCDTSTKKVAPFLVEAKKALDNDLETIRAYIENGIVIDRDKVPQGLKEALDAERLYQESGCEDASSLWDFRARFKNYPHETVTKAAALLAEKVEG